MSLGSTLPHRPPAAVHDEHIARRPVVRTREIPDPGPLTSLLPDAHDALAWVRGGEGLVGWGRSAVVHGHGPSRFATAWSAWQDMTSRMHIKDEVGLPGCGPIAFTSFAFGDLESDGPSILVVPRVVVGRRHGRAWRTEVGAAATEREPDPAGTARAVGWDAGAVDAARYQRIVAEAIRRMRAPADQDARLAKVVLARDLVARFAGPVDHRAVLIALAARHDQCWGFAVDGLVGATPELLVRRHAREVSSRVLAGTSWPGAAEGTLDTPKIRGEHAHAAESLRAALAPFCDRLDLDGPEPLALRHLTHLATDLRGTLRGGGWTPSVLHLAAATHPTAAVGGTPPRLARTTIAELEGEHGLRRGRYAGPVGWVDATGDGELGLALRCAQLSGDTAHLLAGCGIVAESEPAVETAEASAKFRAVADVLDSVRVGRPA